MRLSVSTNYNSKEVTPVCSSQAKANFGMIGRWQNQPKSAEMPGMVLSGDGWVARR
jgi:hypothetical protein